MEELPEELSETEELSEEESEELSEETELEETLVSVLEEEEEELLSALLSEELSEELSLLEGSAEDELSLLISDISIFCELFLEELSPKTASFSIIPGSSLTEQPAAPITIIIESKMQNNFFIIFPLSDFVLL